MKWREGRRSDNVEDRRGRRVAAGGATLGGGAILLLIVFSLLTGEDPSQLAEVLNQANQTGATDSGPSAQGKAAYDERADFVSVVLADTEDTWGALLPEVGRRYVPPTLVLFSNAVESACGFNSSAVGPFYCPGDQKVYIDLEFFDELHRRFGAPGDFAQAYVVAHEVGHHVQNLLGLSRQVQDLRARSSETQANALSVRQELQADCYAGVWAYHANAQRRVLERGDIEEGLNAAVAIGDDRLQRQAGRSVHPESWTHGSSEQRVRWFRRGFETGSLDQCNTFDTNRL